MPKSFRGDQVVRLDVQTPLQLERLQRYSEPLDYWTHPALGNVDVRVKQEHLDQFSAFLRSISVSSTVLVPDVQTLVEQESASAMRPSKAASNGDFRFDEYHDAETLYNFTARLPGVEKIAIGSSYLNNTIYAFSQGSGSSVVYTICGIHAREWISPAVCVYLQNFLASQTPVALQLKQIYKFYTVLVTNPDGYSYTRTTDRLWRKNRQPSAHDSTCVGTDLNRNFAEPSWGKGAKIDAISLDPCSDIYAGDRAASAPEIQAISNHLSNLTNVVNFIDFHSYSQLYLYGDGYTCKERSASDSAVLDATGQSVVAAIAKQNGVQFQAGNSCRILYATSGTSTAFAYNNRSIVQAIALELRDTGKYGFLLPPQQIIASGEEIIRGCLTLWSLIAQQHNLGTVSVPASPTSAGWSSLPSVLAAVSAELALVSIDSPIIASHNDYLLEQSNVIRQRTIPWEGYQKNGGQYVDLFLGLLQKLSRVDTIQSILVFIDDFCESREDSCALFTSRPSSECFGPFFKLLTKEDEYIQLKAAKIMTLLLAKSKTASQTDPTELFRWIMLQLASSNGNVVDIGLQLLQALLSIESYRVCFHRLEGAVAAILYVLKKEQCTAQIQYQAIYNIWLLSFVKEAAADLERAYHITPVLKDIAKSAIKEKVVRIILATFKNMVLLAPQENIIPMLGHKVLQAIEVLSVRKWSDPEIMDDLNLLRDELGHHVVSLSTFDEYASEVQSGRLEWSPPHQSEQFWKVNANRLGENRHELVRMLVDIASTSKDPVSLAVAAHDLGQYVKYGTNAKKVLEECGGKSVVMELMSHENADVRYQALSAVQKIMMNAW
ncbi:H(+)-transporting V1 sector ATPase subunit H [Kappamyces sp. JEL0829]|nr:H(+)-transporting V1 sector ATPase subunit H [Kappamyces sp. JEL0829]